VVPVNQRKPSESLYLATLLSADRGRVVWSTAAEEQYSVQTAAIGDAPLEQCHFASLNHHRSEYTYAAAQVYFDLETYPVDSGHRRPRVGGAVTEG